MTKQSYLSHYLSIYNRILTREIPIFLTFLILCSGGVLHSCDNKSDYLPQLIQAEEYIENNPELALKILENLDSATISKTYNQALFRLNYFRISDKLSLKLPPDTLLNQSVDYFVQQEDKIRTLMSYYFMGLSAQQSDNFSQAVESFTHALDIAYELRNRQWIGLCNSRLSQVFCDSNNGPEALKKAQEGHDYIKDTHHYDYITYSLIDITRAHIISGNNDEALIFAYQLLDSAELHQDQKLRILAYRLVGKAYYNQNKNYEAVNLLEVVCESPYVTLNDSILLGHIYLKLGLTNKAHEIIKAIHCADNNRNSVDLWSLKNDYYQALNDYKSAILAINKRDSLRNIFSEQVNQDLVETLMNMHDENININLLDINYFRTLTIFRSGLLISIIIVLLFGGYSIISNERMMTKMALIDSESIRKDLASSKESVRHLLSIHYSTINTLCQRNYETDSPTRSSESIASSLNRLLDQIKNNSKKINELEEFVNTHYDNIFSNFRTDFPKLKEKDYKLLLFTSLGFSNVSISFLLQDDIRKIYERKRRIKEKVKLLADSERKTIYFQVFGF